MRRGYPGLDLIRLAAALAVALYHFAYFHPRHESVVYYPAFSWGWCGVQVFFVISGFVIAFSAEGKSVKAFIISRAMRLYPAAWICATVSMLIAGKSLNAYLHSVLLLPFAPWVNGVYWTLAVEMAFYALIALSLWRRWPLYRVAILLGCFSVLCWIPLVLGYGLPVGPFGHYGCYFALGMLLYLKRNPALAVLFMTAGAAGVGVASIHLGANPTVPVIAWLAGTLLCVGVVFWNDRVVRLVKILPTRTIGLMTYPLYLIHDDVGRTVLRFGVIPAVALSLAAAFAVLFIEAPIRHAILGRRKLLPLPTGNPV